MLVTEASQEGVLQRIPCIQYPVQFQQEGAQVLLNSGNEVNRMTLAYTEKLGLAIRKTDVDAQKINVSTLMTYRMVIIGFSV